MLKRFLKDNKGSTAMIFAIAAPVFIGGIAFAVELGHWQQKKSKLQDIADTSALAAAQEIMVLGDNANYEFAGKGHAYENGLNFNTGGMTVISPPIAGKYAGKNAVEVVAQKQQKLYFSKFFGQKSLRLQTKSTAMVIDGVPACILALSPTQNSAIAIGGSATVDVEGCGVHANSTSEYAVDIDNVLIADCLSSSGGVSTSNQTSLLCEDGAEPYARNVRDPYSDLRITENVAAMGCTNAVNKGKNRELSIPAGSDSVRICNDVYSSGLIEFTSPGTYYLDGANLGTNSSNSLIYGRGVTLVFMNGGTLTTSNGGNIDITANDEGEFASLVFYFDPLTTTDNFIRINGNQNSNIQGVIYAPTIDIQVNGTANQTSTCTHLIANTVDFRGNAGFTNTDCEALGARQIGGESGAVLVQ